MNKPSIYSFCKAGCQWETMHKDDILNMQKWYVVKPISGNEYYLEYGKEYRITDENKFIYGEQNDSTLWNVDIQIGFDVTSDRGNFYHQQHNVILNNFSKYDAELTFELINVDCHFDTSDNLWKYDFVYKLNGELIVDTHQKAITNGLHSDENVKVSFDDIPLCVTGAKEVLCAGDGTFPVSYTYDFSTLTQVADLQDDDVFVLMRDDEKTYRVSIRTLKDQFGSSGGNGGNVDLSNYYTKNETYSKTEINNKVNVKLDTSMFQDFERSVENTYATKEDLENIDVGENVDLSDYYTKQETYSKTEVDGKIPNLSNYYNKTEVDSKLNKKADVSDLNEVTNSFATKAEVANNHYKKSETYNRSEIDTKIANAGSGGTIDLSNYVDKTSQQEITGTKNFKNIYLTGSLFDAEASSGDAGEFLTSSGSNVKWTSIYNYCYAKDAMDDLLYDKQNTLVSGTNIKTINGEPILGSGDITISGGSSPDLSNYYKKSETYSQEEIDTKHNTLVNKTGNQEISGEKNFCGKVSFYDVINDKDDSVGTAGQILSSTGDGVKWVDVPSGGSTDLSNYYNKGEVDAIGQKATNNAVNYIEGVLENHFYTADEVDDKLVKKLDNSMFTSFATSVESTYATKSYVDEKIAEISDDTSYIYEPITSEIALKAVDTTDCTPLYIKIEGTINDGDKIQLGTFEGEYDIYLWSDYRVDVVSVMDTRQATTIEPGILEIKFDALMDGGIIQPNWANQAYFVERVEEETKVPLGKDYGYTASLEREDVEIDVNKVYELNAIEWDHQLMPSFVLTDNGNPLEMDKIYTLKVLNFLMPQYTQEDYIDIAALFRMKLESGLTENGTGEGRTFAWSDANGEAMGVGYCHLDSGFDISGVVEITFWTDDTASCYVLLSPFATSEW